MIPLFVLVTAFFQPHYPTVGDPITLRFSESVVLHRSTEYELVSQRGNTVVIRRFNPKAFPITGRAGNVEFKIIVPMRSVLKPNDKMEPAPLKPPRRMPYPTLPFVAIGVAALAAIASWTAVALRKQVEVAPVLPALPADEQFRAAVRALRNHPRRWAKLADALRAYLAATTEFSADLTTSELLARLTSAGIIATILRQGDLEKFSPWGAMPMDFDEVAARALELAPEPVIEEQAA